MVAQSWLQGVRYFDTAPGYGNGLSEYRLGQALRRLDRAAAIVSTKVGRILTPARGSAAAEGQYRDIPPFTSHFDYTYDGVMRSVEQSMQRMLTDHFDALFIHDCDRYTHGESQPDYFRQALVGGFPALEALRDQGVVKAIGFGVNETEVMTDAVKFADVDLCLLAGRYSLLEQGPLDELLPMCEERGVGIVLGGVYNSGILATGPVAGARFNYAPAPQDVLARVRAIDEVCTRHGVPMAAAALQFAYAHPAVASICLGARNAEQQACNAEVFETVIPEQLWNELRKAKLIREDASTPTTA